MADGVRIYEQYGYGNRYNPQVVYPDNVQLYIMQQQAERLRKSNEDYAVRQGLKDACVVMVVRLMIINRARY